MQYCRRCRAVIENPAEKCPLCQGALEGEPEEGGQLFPDLRETHSRIAFLFRIFTFFCVSLAIVSIAVNLMFPVSVFWAGFVAAAAACMWLLTAVAFLKRRNLLKNTLWQMLLLCGIFLFWDFLMGYKGWALEYAVPLVILLVFPIFTMQVKLLKFPVSYYMIYYIIAGVLGLLQMLFWAAGGIEQEAPSVLCGAISALVLAGLMIFQGRNFWEEIKKKIHV